MKPWVWVAGGAVVLLGGLWLVSEQAAKAALGAKPSPGPGPVPSPGALPTWLPPLPPTPTNASFLFLDYRNVALPEAVTAWNLTKNAPRSFNAGDIVSFSPAENQPLVDAAVHATPIPNGEPIPSPGTIFWANDGGVATRFYTALSWE